MKQENLVSKLIIGALSVTLPLIFTACEEEFYKDEQYRKEILIVSGDNNIVGQEFTFDENSLGYISIYAGGTRPIEKEVTVDLVKDEKILSEYNQRNYGESYEKYALLLPEERYTIDNMSVTLSSSEDTPYSMFPVHVDINGMIPDETYFLPLRISAVSEYMISSSKKDVLLQVFMKNEYATTKKKTYYKMNGTQQKMKESWGTWTPVDANPSPINATKLVVPISKQGIRILPAAASTTVGKELRKQGIVVTVHPDEWIEIPVINDEGEDTGEVVKQQKVTMDSWFNTQEATDVREIEGKPSYYDPEKKEYTLRYRYKVFTSKDWYEMEETMVPLEITN